MKIQQKIDSGSGHEYKLQNRRKPDDLMLQRFKQTGVPFLFSVSLSHILLVQGCDQLGAERPPEHLGLTQKSDIK